MKSKEAHEADIVEIIKNKKIMFISHIFGFYTDIQRSQFYNLELDKSDVIKEAINQNRCQAKGYLVNKWIGSENPTLEIAAYRLMADDEERRRLDQKQVDITSGQKALDLTMAQAAELYREIDKNC